jgi:hypothetical protein
VRSVGPLPWYTGEVHPPPCSGGYERSRRPAAGREQQHINAPLPTHGSHRTTRGASGLTHGSSGLTQEGSRRPHGSSRLTRGSNSPRRGSVVSTFGSVSFRGGLDRPREGSAGSRRGSVEALRRSIPLVLKFYAISSARLPHLCGRPSRRSSSARSRR